MSGIIAGVSGYLETFQVLLSGRSLQTGNMNQEIWTGVLEKMRSSLLLSRTEFYVLVSCILESCCEVCGIPSVYVALAPNLQTERAILRLSRRVHVILFYVHINTVRV